MNVPRPSALDPWHFSGGRKPPYITDGMVGPYPLSFSRVWRKGVHSFQQPQPLSGPLSSFAERPEGHSGLRPASIQMRFNSRSLVA